MPVKPEEVGLSSPRLARIGEHWQRYIDAGKLAGTLTLMARRGKVGYCEALGHLEIERRRPVTRRLDLAHLLHDEAHHERRADDALRSRGASSSTIPCTSSSRRGRTCGVFAGGNHPVFATVPPARPMTSATC